ncbi:hypothetical protein BDV06DRAFT_22724 [Aspergillus oleicola]
MYNPWGTHHTAQHHGHHTTTHPHPHHHAQAHHPHAHPHAHHAHAQPTVSSVSATGPIPGTVTPGTRLDLDSSPAGSASPSTQSGYQMSASQMRWLPSMITTHTAHNHNGVGHNAAAAAATASLPTISSGLRMQHPATHNHRTAHQQQQQQHHAHTSHAQAQQAPVSMIVDSRGSGVGNGNVNVNNGGGNGNGASQGQVVALESEESDRSESPAAREVSGADALGEPDFAGEGGQGERGEGDIDDEVLGDVSGKGVDNGNGDMVHSSGLNLTTRKHGKRLTTKEEVSLFEICNRHASEFGQRSNLCRWWMTVTSEFTRGQKHPYSWHSVRRKVELVTKQRMKFLEEQRDKGAGEAEDLSNPRWRAVVDTWIPTWQRWEDAEARRIEKRDSRRPRKRKWTVTTPTSTTITTDGWDLPGSSAPSTGPDGWRAPSNTSNSPVVGHNHTPQTHHQTTTAPSATPLSSTPVRLPPGFDTLFSQSQTHTHAQTPASTTSTPFNPQIQAHRNHSHTNHPSTPSNLHTTHSSNNVHTPQTPDSSMMAAVLETLGKLNKHLDSSNQPNNSSSKRSNHEQPPSSSQQNTQSTDETSFSPSTTQPHTNGFSATDTITSTALLKLKETLKNEMLSELRKEWEAERGALEEKLDNVTKTQEMILEMLRQEPT